MAENLRWFVGISLRRVWMCVSSVLSSVVVGVRSAIVK